MSWFGSTVQIAIATAITSSSSAPPAMLNVLRQWFTAAIVSARPGPCRRAASLNATSARR